MAPIRKNKSQKMATDDKIEFTSPRQISFDQRVLFSKNIADVVYQETGLNNFETLFKVSMKTFKYICSIVKEGMVSQDVDFKFSDGTSMSLNDQVAVALRRLSSVDFTLNIANFFRTDISTVSQVTWRFVEALEVGGLHHLSWPSNFGQIISGFEDIEDFPNCCGVIETTRIMMYPHGYEANTNKWRDRQNNNSMLLQAVVDHRMRFLDAMAGFPGAMTYDSALQSSRFFESAQKGDRLNGYEVELSEGIRIQEYLIGGSCFRLLPWLITPYQDELTEDEEEFNRKHLATRMVAKRALRKLKDVWAAIDGGLWQPHGSMLGRIVFACCILHNIMIDMEGDQGVSHESRMSCKHEYHWYPSERSAVVDDDGVVAREKLCLFLNGNLPA